MGGGSYRVMYRVEAPYRPAGHTELIRTLYSAFEQGGVPVETSGEKRVRPKVAFGPPLPAGCTSEGEYFDIVLGRGVDDLPSRLNRVLPAGLAVLSAERIDGRAPPLSAVIDSAEYVFSVPDAAMPNGEVKGRLARFAAERIWQVQRVSPKGKEKTIDLKRAVVRWSCEPAQGGCVVRMRVRLNDPDGHNANPGLVLSGLLRLPEESAALVGVRRVGFFTANGQPIDRLLGRRRPNRSLHRKSYEHLRHLDR